MEFRLRFECSFDVCRNLLLIAIKSIFFLCQGENAKAVRSAKIITQHALNK